MVARADNITEFKGRVMPGENAEDSTSSDEGKKASYDFDYRRLRMKYLTPIEYLLFDFLCDAANEKNAGWCWPSHSTIGESIGGIHRGTVSKTICDLESLGMVEVIRQPKGSHFSDKYRPAIRNTALITQALIDRSSGREKQREELHVEKNDVSRRKKQRGHVVKTDTNVSNRTNPNNDNKTEAKASDAVASQVGIEKKNLLLSEKTISSNPNPNPEKSFYQHWSDRYEAATDFRGRSGVIGECWRTVTGIAPDYSFLNGLAKTQGSGWAVVEGLLKMSGQDVKDDPKGYLIGVLKNGRNQLGGTRGTAAKESREGRGTEPGQHSQVSGGNHYANPALAAKYAHLIIRDD